MKTAGSTIRYPGGKNARGTWQWLVRKMPSHAFYAEPFAGSGALLRHKTPAMRSVAIDCDPDVVAWWERLAWPGVEVLHGCGIDWLEREGPDLDRDWLVYIDPPYPLSTRSHKRIYSRELTEADHARLLSIVTVVLRCRVMVSSYSSPFYEAALRGWSRDERDVMTRGGVLRTEVLWCNFSPGAPGNHAGYVAAAVGEGWRERERISKKLRRWRANYSRMPAAERRAILSALIADEAARATPPRTA